MTDCKICGNEIETVDRASFNDSKLCHDCKILQDGAELLMNKNPRKAICYFTDLFMRARRQTKSEEVLKNCIWEAWWSGQNKQLPN